MRAFSKWIWLSVWLCSCTSPSINTPDAAAPLSMRLGVTGIYSFEDYVKSLTIYAFRRSGSEYLYFSTVAKLDKQAIADLITLPAENSNVVGEKWVKLALPVGDYRLCFLANVPDDALSVPEGGISVPADVLLRNPGIGLNEEYFSATADVSVGSEEGGVIKVVLARMISRVMVRLNGVPGVIDTLQIAMNNVAAALDVTGKPQVGWEVVTHTYALTSGDIFYPDTLLYQFLSFPAYSGDVSMTLRFHSKSGEWKEREIFNLALPPDRYLMITGDISEHNGGLLDFDVTVAISVDNTWNEGFEPDFPINPLP